MHLKVSDGLEGWVVIDDVDLTHLYASIHNVKDIKELENLNVPYDERKHVLVSRNCFPPRNGGLDVGVLSYYRRGVWSTAVFAKTAYILNEQGTTIEKISVTKGR